MITRDELIDFCYHLPRTDQSVQCAWSMSLELAYLYTGPDDLIVLTNAELAERIGYERRSITRQKPVLTEQGYWMAVDNGDGKPSAWLPTPKLINAVIAERK